MDAIDQAGNRDVDDREVQKGHEDARLRVARATQGPKRGRGAATDMEIIFFQSIREDRSLPDGRLSYSFSAGIRSAATSERRPKIDRRRGVRHQAGSKSSTGLPDGSSSRI